MVFDLAAGAAEEVISMLQAKELVQAELALANARLEKEKKEKEKKDQEEKAAMEKKDGAEALAQGQGEPGASSEDPQSIASKTPGGPGTEMVFFASGEAGKKTTKKPRKRVAKPVISMGRGPVTRQARARGAVI